MNEINFATLNQDKTDTGDYKDMQQAKAQAQQVPVVIDPFDPQIIIKTLEKFIVEIDKMDAVVIAHKVTDDASCELATVYSTQAKKLDNTIEKQRVKKGASYLRVTQAINAFCKNLSGRLKGTQKIANDKIRPYLEMKERERIADEKKKQAEADALQAKLDAEAKAEADRLATIARDKALAEGKKKAEAEAAAREAARLAEPAPVVVAEVVQETKVVTDTGKAELKKEWTFEITDFRAIPIMAFEARKAEVIKALTPWINIQVKSGVREMPGVKIFQQTKIETRTK